MCAWHPIESSSSDSYRSAHLFMVASRQFCDLPAGTTRCTIPPAWGLKTGIPGNTSRKRRHGRKCWVHLWGSQAREGHNGEKTYRTIHPSCVSGDRLVQEARRASKADGTADLRDSQIH